MTIRVGLVAGPWTLCFMGGCYEWQAGNRESYHRATAIDLALCEEIDRLLGAIEKESDNHNGPGYEECYCSICQIAREGR